LNLIQNENRPAFTRISRLDASSLPLLFDPIPASECGFVGAREAGMEAMSLNHVAHECRLSDLAWASHRLNEAARLA
jgi:hypothetical protein